MELYNQINNDVCKLNILARSSNDINSNIENLKLISSLFKNTDVVLKTSLENGVSFTYTALDNSVNNDELKLLFWVLKCRFHILTNMKKWISEENSSIKQLKDLYSCMEEHGYKITEDEFLYMSISEVYKGLLCIMKILSKISIDDLAKCINLYYDRTTLLLNVCYDIDVMDMQMFTCEKSKDKYKTNLKFAKHMFSIFSFFEFNIKNTKKTTLLNDKDKNAVESTVKFILDWLITNISKCETFDDISMYYNKFYIKYEINDIDRLLYGEESKSDDYSVYCNKNDKVYTASVEKHAVSSILKAGILHKEFNAACIFSLEHLLKQLQNNYQYNLCGNSYDIEYIIQRCPLKNNFTYTRQPGNESRTFESFIDCFSDYYLYSCDSNLKNLFRVN